MCGRLARAMWGATNVLRTGRKDLALLTLILDGSKGIAAAWISSSFAPDVIALEVPLISGFFAVIGHNFPVWLKFKGGKGVAPTLGFILYMSPLVGILVCGTWLVIAFLYRYSSLASLYALASAPIFAWILARDMHVLIFGFLMMMGFFQHRKNIGRLIRGEESHIGE